MLAVLQRRQIQCVSIAVYFCVRCRYRNHRSLDLCAPSAAIPLEKFLRTYKQDEPLTSNCIHYLYIWLCKIIFFVKWCFIIVTQVAQVEWPPRSVSFSLSTQNISQRVIWCTRVAQTCAWRHSKYRILGASSVMRFARSYFSRDTRIQKCRNVSKADDRTFLDVSRCRLHPPRGLAQRTGRGMGDAVNSAGFPREFPSGICRWMLSQWYYRKALGAPGPLRVCKLAAYNYHTSPRP